MRSLRRLAPAGAVTAVLAVGGCGSSATSASRPKAPAAGSGAAPAVSTVPPPTLPAHAVRYLPSRFKRLTVTGLAREAQAPQLARELRSGGFLAGSERYFQGESRQLQVVDSRTLRFRSGAGAAEFLQFIGAHLTAYLGAFSRRLPLTEAGRSGILVIGQPCQCHLANPVLLAVVARGRTVSWLEINGPRATRGKLVSLLGRAP